jgi:hypothetical protein
LGSELTAAQEARTMLRPLILWLLGVPFGIILLLLLFGIV